MANTRKANILNRFFHGAENVTAALNDAVDAGRLPKAEANWMAGLGQKYLRGHNPSLAEMHRAARITYAVTSKWPPVGALIYGNNRGFVSAGLRRLQMLDGAGNMPARDWLQKVLRNEAAGVNTRLQQWIRRAMIAHFGDDWPEVLSEGLPTKRYREILSVEKPTPDFDDVFTRPARKIEPNRILPGATSKMTKRDPESMLARALTLTREEIQHHIVGRTNPKIVQALLTLLAKSTPEELARRVISSLSYRPTRISEAYIWHAKGFLFEIQMRDRQFELLQHLHDQNLGRPGRYAPIRGAKARLYDKDDVLGPAVDFSDGLIVRLEGRKSAGPLLTMEHIHEMKSGYSGDVQAVLQVEKWTDYLDNIGELVIPRSALVNWVRPAGIAKPQTFEDLLATIGNRTWGRKKIDEVPLKDAAPVEAHRFLMNAEKASEALRKEVKAVAEIDTKTIKDPVFLANSKQRPPDIDDILGPDFKNHVVDPEIQPNLVAEELEWTAIRLLEVVAEDIFTGRIGPISQYFELTSQVLKAT